MAKVTITIEDRESDGAVLISQVSDPPIPDDESKRTDAQNTALWMLEDVESGENFCAMLAGE